MVEHGHAVAIFGCQCLQCRTIRENERLRSALQNIVECFDMRTDIYTNDADMAVSFADKARAALAFTS
jgi:hypothetical protein